MHTIDALSLDIYSVDEIFPSLKEVQTALSNYPQLPGDYEGLNKVTAWVDKLSGMKASDSLTEEDARQLKFELEGAMQRFNDIVLKGH